MLYHGVRLGANCRASGNLNPMTLSKFGLVACAAAGLSLFAQEDAEFSEWMKAKGDANGALRKMEQKTGPEAVKNAERMAGIYEKMIGFWRQRNAVDAVKWSEEGKAAATQLVSAAHSGDAAKASAAFGVMGGTCKSCHDVYRER